MIDEHIATSRGHICFAYIGQVLFEYYLNNDQVWRAPTYNVIDIHTGQRIGRWFGSLETLQLAFDDNYVAHQALEIPGTGD